MNAQLQAQISQILAQIMVSVGEVKDFSMDQLPDIAQQYITYGIWRSSFYSGISFLFLIALIVIGYKIFQYAKNYDDEYYFGLLPVGIITVFSLMEFMYNIHSLILVLSAPKVWFILEIKNLLS